MFWYGRAHPTQTIKTWGSNSVSNFSFKHAPEQKKCSCFTLRFLKHFTAASHRTQNQVSFLLYVNSILSCQTNFTSSTYLGIAKSFGDTSTSFSSHGNFKSAWVSYGDKLCSSISPKAASPQGEFVSELDNCGYLFVDFEFSVNPVFPFLFGV